MNDMDSPKEPARVFFALWPRPREQTALAAWQDGLHQLCGGRLMRPDTLHTTLVFLGEVAADRMEALQWVAQEVALEPFELCFDTAHYWGHNHIVFAAPGRVPPQLERLVQGLQRHLTHHCFHFEQRPYQPHVTLLRHAQWNDAPLPAMTEVRWRCRDFVLVESLRDANGVRYEVLHRFGSRGLA